jgi:hypothetical protein
MRVEQAHRYVELRIMGERMRYWRLVFKRSLLLLSERSDALPHIGNLRGLSNGLVQLRRVRHQVRSRDVLLCRQLRIHLFRRSDVLRDSRALQRSH